MVIVKYDYKKIIHLRKYMSFNPVSRYDFTNPLYRDILKKYYTKKNDVYELNINYNFSNEEKSKIIDYLRLTQYYEGFENHAETIVYLFYRVLTGCRERKY